MIKLEEFIEKGKKEETLKEEFDKKVTAWAEDGCPIIDLATFLDLRDALASCVTERYKPLARELSDKFPHFKYSEEFGFELGKKAAFLGYSRGWGYAGNKKDVEPNIFFYPSERLRECLEELIKSSNGNTISGKIQFEQGNRTTVYSIKARSYYESGSGWFLREKKWMWSIELERC